MDLDPKTHDVVAMPIQEVMTGMSLVIKHDGHAILFRVENKIMNYKPETGGVWTLESEPVDGGEPLRIQGPNGTTVHRIVKK